MEMKMSTKISDKNKKKFITPRKSKQIKKRLIDIGISQRKLAKEIGITPYWLWLIINGRRTSPRIIEYLEKRLGVKI